MNKIAITVAGALLPGVASAHPDHGGAAAPGLAHYLTDPFHVGLAVVAVLAALAVRRTLLRRAAPSRQGR